MAKSIKSYAKINISLDVVRKREDGYHELDSVMLPIELHDSIIIETLKKANDNFVTVDDFSNGLVHYNLATSAINAMAAKYGFSTKFRIYIHKVIPMQAGLGGGSSNAAFTMKAVNQLLKLNATNEELIEIATPLGADIPFFIPCVPSRCRGIGEKLEPIEIKNNYYVLLVKPNIGCSTKEVFALADSREYKHPDIETVLKALREGDDELLASSVGNSLEDPAIALVPEIAHIKQSLKDHGLKIVLISGSGSTVFALSTDVQLLKKVRKELEDHYFVEICKVINK
jgi:4-diphosphocytidyl-2C-methyl-D-erythritol kinase